MGRKNRSQEKRLELLGHVSDAIREDGIEGATLSRIAKRAGVHKSLITYYFSTKDEIIVALVDFITDRYEEAFAEMVAGIDDPDRRLETCLDIIFGRSWIEIVDYRVFYSCFYLSLMNERVRERFSLMYDRLKSFLIREIELGVSQGIVDVEDSEKAAVFIMMLLEGFDYYWAVAGYVRDVEDYGEYFKAHIKTLLGVKTRE